MPPPRELRTVAIKVCVDLGFCSSLPLPCVVSSRTGPLGLPPVGACWHESTIGGSFSGVAQVQSGSTTDEPQVSELPLCRGHIRILTKTATNRKFASCQWEGGRSRALLRRNSTFLALLGLDFVQFLLNSTGGSGCPSGCGVSLGPALTPCAKRRQKISCIET